MVYTYDGMHAVSLLTYCVVSITFELKKSPPDDIIINKTDTYLERVAIYRFTPYVGIKITL